MDYNILYCSPWSVTRENVPLLQVKARFHLHDCQANTGCASHEHQNDCLMRFRMQQAQGGWFLAAIAG